MGKLPLLSTEAQAQIHDVLELLAQLKNTPIAIYQKDINGDAVEVSSSDLNRFPEHCHAVWKLGGGRGFNVCKANTCGRAAHVLKTHGAQTLLCHAGLTVEAETISVDDEPRAVMKYGAYVVKDETDEVRAKRLERHHQAMKNLGASAEEAKHIQELLLECAMNRTTEEWATLRATLPQLVQHILGKYLTQYENERMAYHDLQLRLQAAIADAYNLLEMLDDTLPKGSSSIEEAQNMLGAVQAMRMVMHNLTKGEYLPAEYRFKSHNVLDFINEALNLVHSQAKYKKLDLVVNLSPSYGQLINASKAHLQEAFNNLIQNAVKYSYHTTPGMELAARRYVLIQGRAVDNHYRISISNYGVGIERDEFEKIFEDRYKGRLTRSERRGGVGHGLALTKRIIEAHQGTISVYSEPATKRPADGTNPYQTQFIITLPIKHVDAHR